MPIIELHKKATAKEISDALISAAQTTGFSYSAVNGYKSFECQIPEKNLSRLTIQIPKLDETIKHERLEWIVYFRTDTSTVKIDPASNQTCKPHYERLVNAFKTKLFQA